MNIPLKSKEVNKKYSEYISRSKPERLAKFGINVVLTEKEGVQVKDSDGKSYYDCFCSGGQQVIGNYRAHIREAFREALGNYDLGNFILMSAQKAALAKLLAEVTPGKLKNTVYGVGRGEANDFAMKLVRGATGRKEIISFKGASHGQTGFALSASDAPRQEELFGPLIPGIKRIPLEASFIEQAITAETAGVIIEPIQSDAGVQIPSGQILKLIRSKCTKTGAALIIDEGQTAFGRTGLLFECLRHNIIPDVLNVAKAMGGTFYPISATIFTPRLNRFMVTHPLIHLSTFGGADLGCIVASATIELITGKKLWENAQLRGAQLRKGLQVISAISKGRLGTVRGAGLLLAIETENAKTAEKFTAALAAKNLIALPAPMAPTAIRFTPPIDITAAQIDAILEITEAAAKNL